MELHNFIGYAAAFLGLITFFPQTIKTWRTKETKSISLPMYIMFWLGVALWLVYGIFLKEPPIIIVNAVVITLSSVIMALKIGHR